MNRKIAAALKRDLTSWILLGPAVVCFAVVLWQPLISGLTLSFFETKGYDAVRFVGFKNYESIVSNSEFAAALKNTFSYTSWSLVIGYFVPLITAIILNEMVHLKAFFKFACYFPTIIPSMATALLWYFMFNPGKNGVLNSLLGFAGLPASQWLQNQKLVIPLIVLTMTWRSFGGTMLIYLASLQSINQDIYEAASIDGAGFLAKIRNITLPHIAGTAGLMLIMQIIGVFQIFQEPMAMTGGGPNNASLSIMLSSYYYAFRYFDAGKSMAAGAIAFAILAILTIAYRLASARIGRGGGIA
ncbi:MAG: sugar ABC transporter permease [Clostridiales bacterium]|nr:sugar ABC transporter permease [Clostridiales bacterium]